MPSTNDFIQEGDWTYSLKGRKWKYQYKNQNSRSHCVMVLVTVRYWWCSGDPCKDSPLICIIDNLMVVCAMCMVSDKSIGKIRRLKNMMNYHVQNVICKVWPCLTNFSLFCIDLLHPSSASLPPDPSAIGRVSTSTGISQSLQGINWIGPSTLFVEWPTLSVIFCLDLINKSLYITLCNLKMHYYF